MKPRLEEILPPFPHAIRLSADPDLKWKAIGAKDKTILALKDESFDLCIEEKVDGANVGICLQDGHPKIRSKERMLRKGAVAKKPSKKQFSSIWNWFYKNEKMFHKLEDLIGPCSVYGEWMWMQHGMKYDLLPSWFIAFDIFCHRRRHFLSPVISRNALDEAGFSLTKRLDFMQRPEIYADFVDLIEGDAEFASDGQREGICIKLSKMDEVVHRFKMVKPDFVRGALFDDDKVLKNRLAPK